MKTQNSFLTGLKFLSLLFLMIPMIDFGFVGGCLAKDVPMTQAEYKNKLDAQAKYHQLLRQADQQKWKGNYVQAILIHEQALKMAKGSSLESVSRGDLMRLYEQTNNYSKSLEQVEWFLTHSNQQSPLWLEFVKTKTRLLKKIEEQKQWAAKQDHVVAKFQENSPKASDENQKKFLESLGGKGVWEVFKNGMVSEHDGNFAQALSIYESLIPRKAEIEKEMGITGWVMLYPAIQRNSEALGQTEKEKTTLIWIETNMLDENAPYKQAATKLLPEVVAHIKDRMKVYQL